MKLALLKSVDALFREKRRKKKRKLSVTKRRQDRSNLSAFGSRYDEMGRLTNPVAVPGYTDVSGDGFTNF